MLIKSQNSSYLGSHVWIFLAGPVLNSLFLMTTTKNQLKMITQLGQDSECFLKVKNAVNKGEPFSDQWDSDVV